VPSITRLNQEKGNSKQTQSKLIERFTKKQGYSVCGTNVIWLTQIFLIYDEEMTAWGTAATARSVEQ